MPRTSNGLHIRRAGGVACGLALTYEELEPFMSGRSGNRVRETGSELLQGSRKKGYPCPPRLHRSGRRFRGRRSWLEHLSVRAGEYGSYGGRAAAFNATCVGLRAFGCEKRIGKVFQQLLRAAERPPLRLRAWRQG